MIAATDREFWIPFSKSSSWGASLGRKRPVTVTPLRLSLAINSSTIVVAASAVGAHPVATARLAAVPLSTR